MARRTIRLIVVPGTPRTSLWCPRCNLPSAIQVDALGLLPGGVSRLGTLTVCADCGDGAPSGASG